MIVIESAWKHDSLLTARESMMITDEVLAQPQLKVDLQQLPRTIGCLKRMLACR